MTLHCRWIATSVCRSCWNRTVGRPASPSVSLSWQHLAWCAPCACVSSVNRFLPRNRLGLGGYRSKTCRACRGRSATSGRCFSPTRDDRPRRARRSGPTEPRPAREPVRLTTDRVAWNGRGRPARPLQGLALPQRRECPVWVIELHRNLPIPARSRLAASKHHDGPVD